MRNLMIGTGAALLLALGGCGDGAVPDETSNAIEVPEGDYAERLRAMEDGARNATFIRAIRDAGRDCQEVVSSTDQGDPNGVPTWTAECDNGVQWVIMIGADGVATVASAEEIQAARSAK